MLYDQDTSEDKGLFTFYREQAQREQEMKREKKLRKQLKKRQLIEPIDDPVSTSPSKQLSPIKQDVVRKVYSLKQDFKKTKPIIEKKRLIQSVVDMSSHIEDDHNGLLEKQLPCLKLKEPTFIVKSRKYRQKINELNLSQQHQKQFFQDDKILDEIRIQSLHRKNQSEEFSASRIKAAIHTTRGSLELPDIRKLEERKIQYKPKKSIKSKIIQQALMMKDRDKIKNIRQHLTYNSFNEFENEQEVMGEFQNYSSNSKTYQIFQFHQQSMLFALKKVKRRL